MLEAKVISDFALLIKSSLTISPSLFQSQLEDACDEELRKRKVARVRNKELK